AHKRDQAYLTHPSTPSTDLLFNINSALSDFVLTSRRPQRLIPLPFDPLLLIRCRSIRCGI
ncbi:MAG: hypothetical protein ACRELX_14505, partial [Longimicrobiales bacterium]